MVGIEYVHEVDKKICINLILWWSSNKIYLISLKQLMDCLVICRDNKIYKVFYNSYLYSQKFTMNINNHSKYRQFSHYYAIQFIKFSKVSQKFSIGMTMASDE